MKRGIAVLFFLFGLSLSLLFLHYQKSAVLFIFPTKRIELSFNLFLVLFFLFWILVSVVSKTVIWLFQIPRRIDQYYGTHKKTKSLKALNKIWIAFNTKDYQSVLDHVDTVLDEKEVALLGYLLKVKTQHVLGLHEKRDTTLDTLSRFEEPKVFHIAAVECALDDGLLDVAERFLQKEKSALYSDTFISFLYLRFFQLKKNYRSVLKVLRFLEKKYFLSTAEVHIYRKDAYYQMMKMLDNEKDIVSFIKMVPFTEQYLYATIIVDRIMFLRLFDYACTYIESIQNKHWVSALMIRYSHCINTDVTAQLEFAEKALKQHPNDANLLLCLGRLCMRRSLWGKAKQYLERAFSIEASLLIHIELGKLLDMTGEHEKASLLFRKILLEEHLYLYSFEKEEGEAERNLNSYAFK